VSLAGQKTGVQIVDLFGFYGLGPKESLHKFCVLSLID
jgi:hypothetical protein